MNEIKKQLVQLLNQALKLEHAARVQYLSHAECIQGNGAEPVISRLKEIASDEKEHEDMFRNLIGGYLGGIPTMEFGETGHAEERKTILEINLNKEKEAIDLYKNIYQKVIENKAELPYSFERLEHDIRHIVVDEQEHVSELSLLLGI
ncbi:MAG: hypothetical protein GF384_06610 [Elusimicrobia bacterium]|nr:hypothetical protein [Elusimicrobiota bacterium]